LLHLTDNFARRSFVSKALFVVDDDDDDDEEQPPLPLKDDVFLPPTK